MRASDQIVVLIVIAPDQRATSGLAGRATSPTPEDTHVGCHRCTDASPIRVALLLSMNARCLNLPLINALLRRVVTWL
jgi:hypothetical protein